MVSRIKIICYNKPLRTSSMQRPLWLICITLFYMFFSIAVAENYRYEFVGEIPIRVDTTYSHIKFTPDDTTNNYFFTTDDEITKHIHASLTSDDTVVKMHVSHTRAVIVLLHNNEYVYFRIIQYDPHIADYHITDSHILPEHTEFDFYHCGEAIHINIPYDNLLEDRSNRTESSYLSLSFAEYEPYKWRLETYDDLYTYTADCIDSMGHFCFSDMYDDDESYHWVTLIPNIAPETFDVKELYRAGTTYNEVMFYRPSIMNDEDGDDYDEYQLFDQNGNRVVLPAGILALSGIQNSEGLFILGQEKEDGSMLFGLGVATEGQAEILVSPKYAHIERFSEGLAAFTYDFAKFGFIDEEGNEVIEPCFYMPEDDVMMLFEDGLCRVYTDDGTDAMINHEGKVVEILN